VLLRLARGRRQVLAEGVDAARERREVFAAVVVQADVQRQEIMRAKYAVDVRGDAPVARGRFQFVDVTVRVRGVVTRRIQVRAAGVGAVVVRPMPRLQQVGPCLVLSVSMRADDGAIPEVALPYAGQRFDVELAEAR